MIVSCKGGWEGYFYILGCFVFNEELELEGRREDEYWEISNGFCYIVFIEYVKKKM